MLWFFYDVIEELVLVRCALKEAALERHRKLVKWVYGYEEPRAMERHAGLVNMVYGSW